MLPPDTFPERLAHVRARIVSAAGRAQRLQSDIQLMAVTKQFPAAAIELAYAHGLRDFGENYVQEFEDKAPQVASLTGARFHLVGHLQSNKSRKAAEIFQVIQTVDSAKLARRLDEAAKRIDVMIEVKLSHEEAKHGCAPDALASVVDAIGATQHLQLLGLMTVPPWSEDPEVARPYFAQLRKLAQAHNLPQLSMGMSHDFEAAIEEGSTMIRVGTALFGSRLKP
jgi:pyridoxal phosphate enzyme (YggS family)